MAKTVQNLTERGPFAVVEVEPGVFALLTTSNPEGKSADETQTTLFVQGTHNTTNDLPIIPSPGAGRQIVIDSIILQNETTTENIIFLKAGASIFMRLYVPFKGDGVALSRLGWPLGENNALNLDLNAAAQCGYSVGYHTEAV